MTQQQKKEDDIMKKDIRYAKNTKNAMKTLKKSTD